MIYFYVSDEVFNVLGFVVGLLYVVGSLLVVWYGGYCLEVGVCVLGWFLVNVVGIYEKGGFFVGFVCVGCVVCD